MVTTTQSCPETHFSELFSLYRSSPLCRLEVKAVILCLPTGVGQNHTPEFECQVEKVAHISVRVDRKVCTYYFQVLYSFTNRQAIQEHNWVFHF